MAALFFTNHRMKDVMSLFKQWRKATSDRRSKADDEARIVSQKKKFSQKPIEIDTELANQEVFENYAEQYRNNEVEKREDEDEVQQVPSDETPKSLLLDDSDALKDKGAKKFLEGLKKIGPFSKHILNYSYPPLLYQRGDDEEEDEES